MAIDGQVSGVIPELVRLKFSSGGVLQDEVEHFMLEDSSDMLTGESCHELVVPVHLEIAVLGNHTSGRDFTGAGFAQHSKDPGVEGLFEHHSHQVRLEVEGLCSGFISKLEGELRSSGVFLGHVYLLGSAGVPSPTFKSIISWVEIALHSF